MAKYGVADRYGISVYLDSSSNNIPTAFSTAAGSKIATGLSGYGFQNGIAINNTLVDITFIMTPPGTAPSSSSANRLYIPAGAVLDLREFPVFDYLWIQSEGSTITTGKVYFNFW